jgi:hypothetical protein
MRGEGIKQSNDGVDVIKVHYGNVTVTIKICE